jgi:KDO2-lipid IV(A) lauroyltransferase
MDEVVETIHQAPQPRKISDYLEYAGFYAAERSLNALPLPIAASVSAFFWRLIAPKLKRHQRALQNLRVALPALDPVEQDRLLNAMWDNLGRTSAEAFRLGSIADDASAVTLNFTKDALEVIKGPTPAIFVSLHSGNWEVTALAAEKFDRPLIGVYKKILNPLVDSAVTRVRSRFYKGGLVSRAPDTVRRITRAIKQGYSVALMADLRDSHGDFVPFFGIPSRSTNFPALLARLHHLPVIAVRATRTSPGHFRIDGERLDLAETADRKADIVENTARLQALLERWIRENPALWMWGHRRWNAESFKAMKR